MASLEAEAATVPAEAPAGPGWRRTALALVVAGLLSLLCASFFVDQIAHDAPRARGGVADFSRFGPLTRPVELNGQWGMTWLSAPTPGKTLPFTVPGEWVSQYAGLPNGAAATFRLKILGLRAGRYTLFVPKEFAATRIWVNGRILSERGRFGLTAGSVQEERRAQEVVFELAQPGDVDLGVDFAMFHYDATGFGEPLVFGLSDAMARWTVTEWIASVLQIAALFLLVCYGAVSFVFRPQDRASLWSAATFLMLLPYAAVVSHDDLLLVAFPALDGRGVMGLQYTTSTLALAFGLAYTRALFPAETPRRLYGLLQGLMGLRFLVYAAVALYGDTVLLAHLARWSTVLRVGPIVYILAVVAVAAWRRREGAAVFLLGLGGFGGALIYADLSTNTMVPRLFSLHVVPIGVLMLIFSQMVLLAQRWSLAISAEAQTNSDLRRLLDVNISISSEMQLEALLRKIVQAASTVIRADRSSLFLHDSKSNELWSVVAEGVGERALRFPADRGLAGWVMQTGEPANLAEAYEDPRFNPEIDAETGYHTKSVLTVPVTTREGRRIGVMQALNRKDSPAFGAGDAQRMAAFAAQAAVAIDNATLFTEVQAERNYNESILRSMSSGVVTLDPDLTAAKLNVAAQRILETATGDIGGSGVKAWLQASGLLSEVEAVAAGAAPKTLLDADITTAKGNAVSANLSIVPLIGEQGPTGLLVIVEDITEGKRLQGVMRRFMTQKVVDQVLGREDDVLFGQACQASVLFADIRGFTSLAENLGPRETVEMLNEIFTELFEAVAAADGLLDKFIGDAIMAVYGAPISSGRDPQNAVESAVVMARMIEQLNARRHARGLPELRLGVGIASGEVVAGAIGSPKRMDYTVIGDSVNLASRLEAITKVYQAGIVVCEATARAVEGLHLMRELDTIRVRGRKKPERIFEVLTDAAKAQSPALAAYARGRALLAKRRWRDAAAAFERAAALDGADRPAALMLERARILAGRPPARDWDGVWEAA
jgi:adenylate cyclase